MTDHIMTSTIDKMRGVIGRYPEPGDRYIFAYDEPKQLGVHMLGVSRPLRVSWYLEDTRMKTKTLAPWVGRGTAFADTVIEEPADV